VPISIELAFNITSRIQRAKLNPSKRSKSSYWRKEVRVVKDVVITSMKYCKSTTRTQTEAIIILII
jgi:hypothetical protein